VANQWHLEYTEELSKGRDKGTMKLWNKIRNNVEFRGADPGGAGVQMRHQY